MGRSSSSARHLSASRKRATCAEMRKQTRSRCVHIAASPRAGRAREGTGVARTARSLRRSLPEPKGAHPLATRHPMKQRTSPGCVAIWTRMTTRLLGAWYRICSAVRQLTITTARPMLMDRVLRTSPPFWTRTITNAGNASALSKAPPPSARNAQQTNDQSRCRHMDDITGSFTKLYGNAHGGFMKCTKCPQTWKWAPGPRRAALGGTRGQNTPSRQSGYTPRRSASSQFGPEPPRRRRGRHPLRHRDRAHVPQPHRLLAKGNRHRAGEPSSDDDVGERAEETTEVHFIAFSSSEMDVTSSEDSQHR